MAVDYETIKVSVGTPSAKWRLIGNDDPFGDEYDCPMEDIVMGDISSVELASTIDSLAGIGTGSHYALFLKKLSYVMAGKDRIRWLSRCLHVHESDIVRECNDVLRSKLPYGSHGDDAMAFTLAVDGSDPYLCSDVCYAASRRIKWLVSRLEKYHIQC